MNRIPSPPRPAVRHVSQFLAVALGLLLALVLPERAHAAWAMHGGNAQHTALATVPTQPLQQVHWHTPVDLQPQYSGSDLLIHYGSPLVTEGNTVIVPVKVGVADTFRVEAHRASDGSLLWQLDTDYLLPPHGWTPMLGPALAHGGRLYVAGGGGTLLWTSALDTPGPHTAVRVAFFGDAAYASNPAAFNASLRISTPLTTDSKGTVYFAVQAVVANPLGIQSGIAAVDASGAGRFVSVAAASSGLATQVGTNCAPALSRDEQTLYVGVRGSSSAPGYLLALATSDLSTRQLRALIDPKSGQGASVSSNGTSTPMVAPDDKVYFGALDIPFGTNAARGWMFQFDAALNPAGAPGAFGWDHTPSLVPAAAAPSYVGSSPYLLMCKYNFYAGIGTGENRIAILDPFATQIDPFTAIPIMKEVVTILGPTPDPDQGPSFPNAVKEWCINTAVVDPFTHSVLAGSEDGRLYRWDLATNSFSQSITLTTGVGEAYTPTVTGPDGQVYAINNATLFAVGASSAGAPPPPVAAGFALGPPRPNPFTEGTQLRFRLPGESNVRIEVFDLRGARVRLLADRRLAPGEYPFDWDGRDDAGGRRPPGVYLVRVAAGAASATQRVFLTR